MINTFINSFNNLEFAYSTIIATLSIGLFISSLEELVAFPVYSDSGLLSWKISKHRSSFYLKGYLAKLINFILSELRFREILYGKIILSLLLLVASFFKIFPPALILLIFALTLLTQLRSPYGLDGSYQMNVIVLLGLSIASLAGVHSNIGSVCLWFIAGELILSYFIAGLAKLISPIWRKSHALPAIFSTKTYGHKMMFQLVVKHKALSAVLCWPMLLFELLFIVTLFSPHLCFVLCIVGFFFHLFNAVFMGLNTFFFSFLCTYPALFYCCSKLN